MFGINTLKETIEHLKHEISTLKAIIKDRIEKEELEKDPYKYDFGEKVKCRVYQPGLNAILPGVIVKRSVQVNIKLNNISKCYTILLEAFNTPFTTTGSTIVLGEYHISKYNCKD